MRKKEERIVDEMVPALYRFHLPETILFVGTFVENFFCSFGKFNPPEQAVPAGSTPVLDFGSRQEIRGFEDVVCAMARLAWLCLFGVCNFVLIRGSTGRSSVSREYIQLAAVRQH